MDTLTLPSLPLQVTNPTLIMNLAANSNMFIKLYVDDGCGYEPIGIPLKQLLSNQQYGSSYDTLRHFSLAALFSNKEGKVPEYASKNFGTSFICKCNGKRVVMRNDNELSEVLEAVCTDYLMEDNEGIVLDIYCEFVDNFMNMEVKKIRKNATAAADKVFRKMKVWIEKTSKIFDIDNEKTLTDAEDFVVVQNDKECKDADKEKTPINWALKFVHILLEDETDVTAQKAKKALRHQKADLIFDRVEGAFDHLTFALVDGYSKVNDFIDEVIARHEDAAREFMVRSTEKKMDIPRNNSITGSRSGEDSEKKIIFDLEDKNAPEEWKIFFDASHEEDEEGAVIVEFPEDGVISLSSQDSDGSKSSEYDCCNEAANFDDDDSWAMLDNEM